MYRLLASQSLGLETEAQKLAGHELHLPMDMFCLAGKVLRFLQISSNIYKI